MALEMGKSLTDARGEVAYAAEFFRWFSEEAVRIGGELRTAPSGANRILTFRKPVGVCAAAHAVELPGRHGHPQDRPGARRGLHGGAQAGRGHAADRAAARASCWPRPARRPAWSTCSRPTSPASSSRRALADARVRKLSFTGSTGVGRHPAQAGGRAHRQLARWSSAATTRSSCSTTPISTPRSTARCWPRCATAGRPAPRRTASSSQESVAERVRGQARRRGWARCASGAGTDEDDPARPDDQRQARRRHRRQGRRARSRPARRRCSAATRPTAPGSSTRPPC